MHTRIRPYCVHPTPAPARTTLTTPTPTTSRSSYLDTSVAERVAQPRRHFETAVLIQASIHTCMRTTPTPTPTIPSTITTTTTTAALALILPSPRALRSRVAALKPLCSSSQQSVRGMSCGHTSETKTGRSLTCSDTQAGFTCDSGGCGGGRVGCGNGCWWGDGCGVGTRRRRKLGGPSHVD